MQLTRVCSCQLIYNSQCKQANVVVLYNAYTSCSMQKICIDTAVTHPTAISHVNMLDNMLQKARLQKNIIQAESNSCKHLRDNQILLKPFSNAPSFHCSDQMWIHCFKLLIAELPEVKSKFQLQTTSLKQMHLLLKPPIVTDERPRSYVTSFMQLKKILIQNMPPELISTINSSAQVFISLLFKG